MDTESVKELATALGAVLAAAGGVLAFFRDGREKIVGGCKGLWKLVVWITTPIHGPWSVSHKQARLDTKLDQVLARSAQSDEEIGKLRADVAGIKYEMNPNGWDSMKDVLTLLLGNFKQSVRDKPYPVFICDGDGRAMVVSGAFCSMVGAGAPQSLLGFDWRRWLFQEDREVFCRAFGQAASTRSAFRGTGRWVNGDSVSVGRWEVGADVMIHGETARLLYRAILKPVDEEARKWSKNLGFRYDTP